tara:strand:+ start:58 stop:684 length:627 start_codon:yes stop_codon:yes gene_type:complete
MITLFLENFVLLFLAIDPISLVPVFASLTKGLNKSDIAKLCLVSGFTTFTILTLFWFFGSKILEVMGISLDSFKIVGGVFLLIISYELVFEKRQERRSKNAKANTDDETIMSLATFPLSFPLIVGPSAITISMLLSAKPYESVKEHFIGFSPVIVVLTLTVTSLWVSSRMAERLPVWVVGVLQRIFGLLLGALAIEFVIQGLKQAFAI